MLASWLSKVVSIAGRMVGRSAIASAGAIKARRSSGRERRRRTAVPPAASTPADSATTLEKQPSSALAIPTQDVAVSAAIQQRNRRGIVGWPALSQGGEGGKIRRSYQVSPLNDATS
jgi:hypothetical protein